MCADIVIMRPQEDVCATCSDYQSRISQALTEDDRVSLTDLLCQHITKAIGREFYRSCIAKSKIAVAAESEITSYCHLTFDFAQQATIPHHARQVGALYFRVLCRILIFGVANEGTPAQFNYLHDRRAPDDRQRRHQSSRPKCSYQHAPPSS